MKKPLQLPKFLTEDDERDLRTKLDLADSFEAKDFQALSFPNLTPSSRDIPHSLL